MKRITVHNLDKHPTRPYQEFIDLQGDFKTYFEIKKLADRIAEAGFKYDFFTWESPEEVEHNGIKYPKETFFIIDAHARQRALQLLERDGYKIPPVSYTRIQAESLIEAKSEILFLNSRYGEIQSTSEFLENLAAQLPPLAFENVVIPEVDLSVFSNNEAAETDESADELPEEPEHIVIKIGDLIELGEHRVICGDCTDKAVVEKVMGGEKADMVFTDPPYGISVVGGAKAFGSVDGANVVKANKYEAIIGDDKSFDPSICFQASIVAIFGGNYFANKLPNSRCWLIWDKKGRDWDDNFSDFELVWTNLDKPAKIFRHIWMGMVQEYEREKRIHPTQKPSKLCADMIDYLKSDAENILDMFLGSGSTLIACEKTSRKCRGIEISEKYCQVIVQRYVNYTNNSAIRINGKDVNWDEYKQ